ncbi:MAG: L-histidine N(alpha)-methyltransferase [Phycisphaerae bacterium]
MNAPKATFDREQIIIDDALAARGPALLVADVMEGLRQTPKRISSMFLYDDRGSQLFEQITALPEYYPTRTEKSLLRTFSRTVAPQLSDVDIVELGSGDCSKISLILDGIDPANLPSVRYVPVDVSAFAIRQSAGQLTRRFPSLAVHGLVADFLTQLDRVPCRRRRLFCLLGSTIGNLSGSQRDTFLQQLGEEMEPGDEFLLGLDLVKPVDVLEKAYNDGRGVTAEFNRNILRSINALAKTNFRPELFEHLAFYNSAESRIEMHLRAAEDMEVRTPLGEDDMLGIAAGETINTEDSHKFTVPRAKDFLQSAGLRVTDCLQDPKRWFGLLRACPSPRGRYVEC